MKIFIDSNCSLRLDDTQMEGVSNESKKSEYDQAVRLFKTSKFLISLFFFQAQNTQHQPKMISISFPFLLFQFVNGLLVY